MPEADLEHVVTAGYTQRHVLDVLTIVALKTLSNYVNHIAHTPLDPQFAPQAWKAQAATVARREGNLAGIVRRSQPVCGALTSADSARQL